MGSSSQMMVSIISCGDVTTVELRKNGIYCAEQGSRKSFPVKLITKALYKYFKIRKPADAGRQASAFNCIHVKGISNEHKRK